MDMALLQEINACRSLLFREKLIGVNSDGIGYGNISVRHTANNFIITGSGTGKLDFLSNAHYSMVTGYDVEANIVTAQGPVIASSESLTHAVIYELQNDVNAVIHVHHFALWSHLLRSLPSTAVDVEYGTPFMAREIRRLFNETDLGERKMFTMAGHEGGIVSFGSDCNEALSILMDELRAYH